MNNYPINSGFLSNKGRQLAIEPSRASQTELYTLCIETLVDIRDSLQSQNLSNISENFLHAVEIDLRDIINLISKPRNRQIQDSLDSLEKSYAELSVALRLYDTELEKDAVAGLRRRVDSVRNFIKFLDNAISYWPRQSEIRERSGAEQTRENLNTTPTGRSEEQVYQSATKVAPQSAIAWKNLGNFYYSQGKYDDAIPAYKTALEVGDKDVATWINLGNSQFNQKRYDEAEGTYRYAIELDPKNTTPWLNLGNIYYAQKKFEEAVFFIQKAIEINPTVAIPWISLGNVYAGLGVRDKAISAYQKAVEIDPTSAQAQSNLQKLLQQQTNLNSIEQTAENTEGEYKSNHSDDFAQSTEAGDGSQPPVLPSIVTPLEQPEPSLARPSTVIKSYTITDEALEKRAASDKPIQDVKQDKLGFTTYVNALHEFIIAKDTTTPLTIAVDGQWGSGKSSLMLMLKNRLEPNRNFIFKFFDYWKAFIPWWKWFGGYLWVSPARIYRSILFKFLVRDVDRDGNVELYIGQGNTHIKNYLREIAEGFSLDIEILKVSEDNLLSKRVRWWADIRSKSEPKEPPSHLTVWLNAWKFDNQEEVWASLALATMEQIKKKHGLVWRLRFWWDLTFHRFSFWPGLWQVSQQFLLPLTFAGVAVYYDVIMGSFDVPLDAFKQYGNPLLWAGAVISGILSVSSIFKDPFQISLEKVFDHPNYKDKVRFLSHFEKDFAKIVQAATKNGLGWKRSKLVIFIDDLDRCEPPKAADVIEAINLFLDAEGCVFVVGMDSDAVAMSVEVKYKDLFERMKTENGGVVSLGRAFLAKIVQIPFSMPRPTAEQIKNMVDDTLGGGLPSSFSISQPATTQVLPTPPPEPVTPDPEPPPPDPEPTVRIDPASYARKEVRQAIRLGTELLSENPRQVKTFINLFRLSIYIANERKILEERQIGEKSSGILINDLAVWVACSVRWPNLIRRLYNETRSSTFRDYLAGLSEVISKDYRLNQEDFLKYKNRLEQIQKNEKENGAHWCHLPWSWWFGDPDFLRAIKLLEKFWPGLEENKTIDAIWDLSKYSAMDWLQELLTMTKPISSQSVDDDKS